MEKILLLLLALSLIFMIIKYAGKHSDKEPAKTKKEWNPFYLRQKTMNSSEQALYINLVNQLTPDYVIFPKTRIEDFIGVKRKGISRNERFGLRNRIKSRHVDLPPSRYWLLSWTDPRIITQEASTGMKNRIRSIAILIYTPLLK